jgi:Tol biopolymer transport system component/tRNA A-37 threonylcarbamoyl transferase component Bud32
MPLAAGTKLGPYEINSPLGAGGMGEVYLAQDTRLGRRVAIKILPDKFSCDSQRMARFDREAKVLASLNHPNIAAIYGLEDANGIRALVMELVDGPTLAERIKQAPLPLDETLLIAKQIAQALEYAHERSIIHRDLKPSNVKIAPNGEAKVLDFGLAKALEGDSSVADLSVSTSPTLSQAATQAGMLLGTAAYMSPEQARGKKVDRRADIWAFGVVLYETLARKPAFLEETTSDTLAAVIRGEPDWSALPGNVPTSVLRLLRRCLTKDPNQRLRDIGEARIAIDGAISGTPEEAGPLAAPTEPPLWRRAVPWAVAAIAIVFAIACGALYWRGIQREPHPVMQLSLPLAEPLAGVFDANPGSPFALAPDGSQIAYVASVAGKPQQLYLRALEQQTATPIPGTENAIQPFFSPDGQWVGFFALGKMRKVSLHGGPVTPLCDAPVPHGANWASDDTITYAPNFGSGLMRISAAGGTPKTLTTPNAKEQEISHRWPQVLPEGKFLLFTIQVGSAVSFDDAWIAVLSLETGKWRTVIKGGSYARYVSSGHIVYAHAGALMAVPFDLKRMEVAGSPMPVREGVVTTALTSGGAEYDVTESGLLAYVPGNARPPVRTIVSIDRNGTTRNVPAPPRFYSSPRLSPDGKFLALQVNENGSPDIWVYEFARNTLTRLTFGPGVSSSPLWNPDGRRIVYSTRTDSPSFRSKLADGSGAEETLFGKEFDDQGAAPLAVSPDGKTLLFSASNAGRLAIEALSLDGSEKIQPFLQSSFNIATAKFSPDGHWITYSSDESGRWEIYVQPFPGLGGKWMISSEGGQYPRWTWNGREIFYRSGDKVMAVPVETQPAFKAGTPRMWFPGEGYVGLGNYDIAADGEHLVMLKQEDTSTSPKELNVVLNWSEELKRRAPAEKK